MQLEEEGCLSVPASTPPSRGRRAPSSARSTATAHARRSSKAPACSPARFSTRVDHLDGVLFLDRLRGIKRDLIVAQDPEAAARRQVVNAAARRLLRHAGVRGADARGARSLTASGRRRRHPARRPRGRGQQAPAAPVKALALSDTACPCCSRARLKDDATFSTRCAPSTPTSAWSRPTARSCRDDCSDRPRSADQRARVAAAALARRGARPSRRSRRRRETGVTIMRVVEALDAGPMLAACRTPIGPDETSVDARAAPGGARRRAARRDRRSPGARATSPRRRRTTSLRDLRARSWTRGARSRLDAPGARDPQPDSRHSTRGRWPPRCCAGGASCCIAPRSTRRGADPRRARHDRRRRARRARRRGRRRRAARCSELQPEGRPAMPRSRLPQRAIGSTPGDRVDAGAARRAMSAARAAAARVLVAVERGRTTLAAKSSAPAPTSPTRATARSCSSSSPVRCGGRRSSTPASRQSARARSARSTPRPRRPARSAPTSFSTSIACRRTPSVHESVEVVRARRARRAPRGFVNAVLRALARRDAPACRRGRRRPATARRWLDYLSVTLSHPDGSSTAGSTARVRGRRALVPVQQRAAAVTFRAADRRRPRRRCSKACAAAGVEAEPAPSSTDAIRLPAGDARPSAPTSCATRSRPGRGSQLVAHAAGARPGERVLDVCAAPGGKTPCWRRDRRRRGCSSPVTSAAPRVALLARHASPRSALRAPVLRRRDAPCHSGRCSIAVLLDAPCSGLGMLRRDPDLKWSRRPEAISPRFADAQTKMLDGRRRGRAAGRRLDLRDLFERARGERARRRRVPRAASGIHRGAGRVRRRRRDAAVLWNQAGFLQTPPFRARPRRVLRRDAGRPRAA